jgi:acetyl-CoA carboxylase biotin carboxylase subunit
MLKRVLIANRGEIALRILRTCREMGIETVAVYSEADKESLAVQLATQAVCIGPARAADSYLNQMALLTAAQATGCDGIHPGYGFLSENADFADACAAEGLTFIGPSGAAIRAAGSKSAARARMVAAGVPVTPGSDGPVTTVEAALAAAEAVGYPVLLKASAGGGGRGIRRCDSAEALPAAYAEAKAEARACFGDDEMYLEKLVLNPRHIEFQILADRHGHVIHLGGRDCSVQRRNQKLIEEAPPRCLSPALREEMGAAAVRAAQAVGYENAGTIEFLLDADGEHFYFMEMNTRIQVEHGVTELVTGVDLIREQLRIASGLPLDLTQEDVHISGHAIECRINAEDPERNFCPCPGTVEFLHLPGGTGVRVDSALYNGCTLSPYYDSMAAKVLVHAPTRLEAIRKMRRCLEEFMLEGFTTNVELSYQILYHPTFVRGLCTTGFLDRELNRLLDFSRRANGQAASVPNRKEGSA